MIYVLIGLFLGFCFMSLVSLASLREKNARTDDAQQLDGDAVKHKRA